MKSKSKTAKIRALLRQGVKPVDIVKQANCHISTVYWVRHMDKAQELPLDHPIFEKAPAVTKVKKAKQAANAVQVGGSHYKDKDIQPWDVINAWGMGFFDGNALKYLARFRNKGGVEDLRKARHYIDKLIEVMVTA